MYLLVKCKILGLFVKTLTAGDKYVVLNRDNLLQHIHMQLFQKQNRFSKFFLAISKFGINFEHFRKKGGLHS